MGGGRGTNTRRPAWERDQHASTEHTAANQRAPNRSAVASARVSLSLPLAAVSEPAHHCRALCSARMSSFASASSSSPSSSFLSSFLRANDPRLMTRWAVLERAAAYAFLGVLINKIRKIDLSAVIKVSHRQTRREGGCERECGARWNAETTEARLDSSDTRADHSALLYLVRTHQVIPGAAGALQSRIDSETTAAVAGAFPAALNDGAVLRIPAEPEPYDAILARMRGFQTHEPNPRKGRVFGYMYEVMDHDLESFIQKAFVMSGMHSARTQRQDA